MSPLKTILCPIDFSEPSLCALDTAAQWALHFEAELHVIHVLPLLTPNLLLEIPQLLPSDKERSQEAWQKLRDLTCRSLPHNLTVVSDVRIGYPAQEILRAAEDEDADLLILATHGHTGWRHFVFGSVAEEVVRGAHCPVLTIHAPTHVQPPLTQQATHA